MTERPDDLVRVASGELVQVQVWANALTNAGVQARVVGGNLSAGIGSALPDPAELWVHRGDLPTAERVIAGDRPHGYLPPPDHEHPTDDPKPGRGPTPSQGNLHHRPYTADAR